MEPKLINTRIYDGTDKGKRANIARFVFDSPPPFDSLYDDFLKLYGLRLEDKINLGDKINLFDFYGVILASRGGIESCFMGAFIPGLKTNKNGFYIVLLPKVNPYYAVDIKPITPASKYFTKKCKEVCKDSEVILKEYAFLLAKLYK